MNLQFYIAKRYIFAKKTRNAINVISAISVISVAIVTAALIILLSVTNGFNTLIKSFYSNFDPDFKVTVSKGKVFSMSNDKIKKLINFKEIDYYTEVLEENALVEYEKKQNLAKIKGVSDDFHKTSGIDSMIINGEYKLRNENENFAIPGWTVAYKLSVDLNVLIPLKIWVPKRNAKLGMIANKAFNIKRIFISGVFSVNNEEYDSEYIIVPINFARELLEYKDEATAIEIKLKENIDKDVFQKKADLFLGEEFNIKNRYQQHEFLYKIMESEKLAIYLILSFILLIASFNLIGSLTTLIIDKKNDIITLQNLGADNSLIRKIFLLNGWFISIIGAIIGLVLGSLIVFIQKEFGIIEFPSNFIVRFYPVEMEITDFIFVLIIVLLIGFLTAWYPVRYISKKHLLI